ncbi:MAG: alpha-amylase [Bacteroidaceae bacterium]|nr:alpha-amylase [Bacteroidaceae bacterium]
MKKLLSLVVLLATVLACTPTRKKGYTLPDPHDVVMYEVNPLVFAQKNAFNVIANRLDSIRDLGVNVIWFMPTYEQGVEKAKNSPYCIKNYKAVNPNYGTLEDFKRLVDLCHEKGMSVIMDWVANHTSWDNVWMTEHPDWYTHDEEGNIIWPATTNWEDVADLNFDNADMRLAMIDAMKYWVTEVGIDGYRCDAADFVPFDFWKQAVDSMRALPKPLLMLAEGKRADHFDAGFDMNYSWDYMNANRDVFQRDSSAVKLFMTDYAEYDTIPQGKVKLRFITNHDEAAGRSPVQEYGGVRGSMAAFVETVFIRGGALLYGSQEVAYPERLNFFHWKPIDWMSNPEIYNEYKQLLGLYNKYGALKWGQLIGYPAKDVMVFEKLHEKQDFLVLVNVRNHDSQAIIPQEWQNKKVADMMNGGKVELPVVFTLKPYEYYILKK